MGLRESGAQRLDAKVKPGDTEPHTRDEVAGILAASDVMGRSAYERMRSKALRDVVRKHYAKWTAERQAGITTHMRTVFETRKMHEENIVAKYFESVN